MLLLSLTNPAFEHTPCAREVAVLLIVKMVQLYGWPSKWRGAAAAKRSREQGGEGVRDEQRVNV